ncbi:MAG: hypothetical protein ABIM89_09310 [Mycobacteriales bacterium]
MPDVLTLRAIEDAIRDSWSIETCDPVDQHEWSRDNAARGQCGVTALVVSDLLGGVLLEAQVFRGGVQVEYHYWNRLTSGLDLDLTREQFTRGETFSAAIEVPPLPPGPAHAPGYALLAERVRARLGPAASAAGTRC